MILRIEKEGCHSFMQHSLSLSTVLVERAIRSISYPRPKSQQIPISFSGIDPDIYSKKEKKSIHS